MRTLLTARLILLGLALGLPLPARAQTTPETAPPPDAGGAPAKPAGTADTPPADATVAAAAPAPLPAPDPAALARALGAERRVLRTERGEFGVIVTPAEAGTGTGTLLLLPADGQFPGASPGIARLREEMPFAGWTTWLLELEAPPRVQSLGATDAPAAASPAETTPPPADAGNAGAAAAEPAPEPAKPAAGSSESAPAAPAPEKPAEGAPASADAAEAPVEDPGIALDKRLGEAHAQWILGNRERVAAALAAAAGAGPVVLVAEGSASPVLVAALDKAEGLAALVLLVPVTLDEAPFAWPEKLPLPVLEVLEPGASPEDRAGSRERAHAAGVGNYRLMLLSLDGPAVGPRESLLTRRVRGWLRSLSRPPGG